jgi:hypothetical protein
MIAGTMIKRELSKNWLFSFRQKQDIDPIMLQNTFMHIQSIGAITEQRIWESGLSDWDAFSDDISIPLSGKRK